ncbi:MAG: dihydrofolate reductase family protein [Candidatus Sericytochromatia bacterium]
MRELIYHVGVSLDGYIAAPDGNADGFPVHPEEVADYFLQLKAYDTVLMGKNTYLAGLAGGLIPGQLAYPHLRNLVFSKHLDVTPNPPALGPLQQRWLEWLGLPESALYPGPLEVVRDDAARAVASLKAESGAPIYLCGGGQLASTLRQAGLIDQLWLKLYPVLLGAGIGLFNGEGDLQTAQLLSSQSYPSGTTLLKYRLGPAA